MSYSLDNSGLDAFQILTKKDNVEEGPHQCPVIRNETHYTRAFVHCDNHEGNKNRL